MSFEERAYSNRLLFYLVRPDRLVRLSHWLRSDSSLRILDIGCGNHSVRYFRAQYPRSHYTGVDQSLYNNTAADVAAMD